MKVNDKRCGLYLLRWQASTPILAGGVGILLATMGQLVSAMVANLIGGPDILLVGPVHLYIPVACFPRGSPGEYCLWTAEGLPEDTWLVG